MDNQQGKTDDIKLAWLAGFIDGEGSFMVMRLAGQRLKSMKRDYFVPRITICGTHQPTLPVVAKILDDHKLPYHISTRTSTNPKWKPAWDLRVQGFKRAQHWLEVLLPYLNTKREDAEAMLEYVNSRLTRTDNGRKFHDLEYTEREVELMSKLRGRYQK